MSSYLQHDIKLFLELCIANRVCQRMSFEESKPIAYICRYPPKIGFNSITFSENSNHSRESLLEVERQNIAGHQQTFENKKFVDITHKILHQDLWGISANIRNWF